MKNVSGRLLVGLRYWNEVTDEGSNWRFESLEEVLVAIYCRGESCQQRHLHVHTGEAGRGPTTSAGVVQGQREVNAKDKFIFWWSLYLTVSNLAHSIDGRICQCDFLASRCKDRYS